MRILLAEDDEETRLGLGRQFVSSGHDVLLAADGMEALRMGRSQGVDVFVLDRMLPSLDGLSVLKALRADGVAAPALLLTALGQIEDRVEGLDAGADDYLVKPFAYSELMARLNALVRRGEGGVETVLTAGSVSMDLLKRTVQREGHPVLLQPREFRLLEELLRNSGRVVTRRMLLERVWHFHFDPQTNIVETHMSRMRRKLNEGFADDPIETVRGEGYKMRADV
jgi:two-component system OmpR family response regulator